MSEFSTVEVVPPVPSVLHDPVAAPPWLDVVPDRKLLVVDAVDRGILFVSWIRPGGARLSAEVRDGYAGAVKVARAIAQGTPLTPGGEPETPLIVTIGREMYEGLPPKRPRSQPGGASPSKENSR